MDEVVTVVTVVTIGSPPLRLPVPALSPPAGADIGIPMPDPVGIPMADPVGIPMADPVGIPAVVSAAGPAAGPAFVLLGMPPGICGMFPINPDPIGIIVARQASIDGWIALMFVWAVG